MTPLEHSEMTIPVVYSALEEAPPCPDITDPGVFVRGSLLRLLHATPEQQRLLLATEEYGHLQEPGGRRHY